MAKGPTRPKDDGRKPRGPAPTSPLSWEAEPIDVDPKLIRPGGRRRVPDLLDRILGNLTEEESELSISYPVIIAVMREFNRGELTQNQIVNNLNLSAADWAGLSTVYTNVFVTGTYTMDEVEDLLVLGSTRNRSQSSGDPYYAKATIKSRLGL